MSAVQLGWVEPDGTVHPADHFLHDEVLDALGLSTKDAERLGWCRISMAFSGDGVSIQVRSRGTRGTPDFQRGTLTREQVTALLAMGHRPDDHLLRNAEGDWSHLLDGGGSNAVQPPTPITTQDRMDPRCRTVICPFCGQAPGHPCRPPEGHAVAMRVHHNERVQALRDRDSA